VRAEIVLVVLTACGEPSSPPPTAPTATAPLEVPPLPPPKPSAEKPVAPRPIPDADDGESMLPRDPAAAEIEFQQGKRAMAAGDDAKARSFFLRSYRLEPAIGTLLNLALVEERLGMKDYAIAHYQAVIDASQKAGRSDRAVIAKARLDALKNLP
jgi:hypothetical protein